MSQQFGPEYVRAIAPYQAGKPIAEVAREFGLDEASIVKLASNENPFGVPESSKQAMAAAVAELGRYPDANGFDLKAALSKRYDVPADWITLGNGSNDILEIAAHAFVQGGQAVVYSQYSFAVYALMRLGYTEEAKAFTRWSAERPGHGPDVRQQGLDRLSRPEDDLGARALRVPQVRRETRARKLAPSRDGDPRRLRSRPRSPRLDSPDRSPRHTAPRVVVRPGPRPQAASAKAPPSSMLEP